MTTQESMEIAAVVDGFPQWVRERMANHVSNLGEIYRASGVSDKPLVRVRVEHPALSGAEDQPPVAAVIVLASRRAGRA